VCCPVAALFWWCSICCLCGGAESYWCSTAGTSPPTHAAGAGIRNMQEVHRQGECGVLNVKGLHCETHVAVGCSSCCGLAASCSHTQWHARNGLVSARHELHFACLDCCELSFAGHKLRTVFL
jgi:hypothetical protein